jgi:hypothetical protein
MLNPVINELVALFAEVNVIEEKGEEIQEALTCSPKTGPFIIRVLRENRGGHMVYRLTPTLSTRTTPGVPTV